MGHLTPLYDTLAGPTAKAQARAALNALLSDGKTVFDYQPGGQVSAAGLVVDSWTTSIGPAPQLAAAGAARPIWLPFNGRKYAYNNGALVSFFSTPDAPANQIIGDLDMRCLIDPDQPIGTVQIFISKKISNLPADIAYLFYMQIGGQFSFSWSNGLVVTTINSTATYPFAQGTPRWARLTFDVDNGLLGNDAKFWTAPDVNGTPGAWVQLGATVTTAGIAVINNVATPLQIIAQVAGGASGLFGKMYRASISNVIGGNPVQEFNAENWPETATNGATAVSSTTGETWTLSNSGNVRTQIVGSPQALFNGTANTMAMATALVQPASIYLYAKQVTWTANEYMCDGAAPGTMAVQQTNGGASPQLSSYAGILLGPNANLPLNQWGAIQGIFNGANSSIKIDATAAVVGNAGAANGAGFTLGSASGGGGLCNMQAKEAIGRRGADSAALQAQIVTLLNIING